MMHGRFFAKTTATSQTQFVTPDSQPNTLPARLASLPLR
jgi:hypothetical protein